MKYALLQIFIQLGYNTLITDMDLVYIQNPFNHLHRCLKQLSCVPLCISVACAYSFLMLATQNKFLCHGACDGSGLFRVKGNFACYCTSRWQYQWTLQ